ncbi:MAG: nucleotidyltransferase domain-containing protein [Acidobacteriota bacterium]|jgi:predicted nucleotidyltransferase|nr:nucleotidyltransferase domain-containing protein [Acidobacteriota bacterium]
MEQDKPNADDAILADVRDVLAKEPGLRLAIVYGSAVTGRMRPDSDVDVAVLYDKPLGIESKLSLYVRLSDALRREVDLVDLHGLGGELLRQILCKGRLVIKKDTESYYQLMRRMIYNEADFMPLVRRMQDERIARLING